MTELETEMFNALEPLLAPYLEKFSSRKFDVRPGLVEVKCQQDDSELTWATLLRIEIIHADRQVRINSISTPGIMKGQGLGKILIKAIYIAAKARGYEVFVTDMTPGFYQRLLRRGARSCNEEMVQINDDTVLA